MVEQIYSEDRKFQEDRRFQIFISSTFMDLKEERKKAISVVVDQHHIPIALENFAASHATDFEVIEKSIEDSQIYLVILGHRYGEISEGKDKSYTEIEYDLAEKNGLLIIPFILCNDEIKIRRDKLDHNNPMDLKEINNKKLLEDFHEKVKKRFYKQWSPEDEFKYLVLEALKEEIPKCQKPGLTWEGTTEQKQFLTYASGNEFIVQIVRSITRFEKLDQRCTEKVDKKTELARFFVQKYGNQIIKNKINLFLESGSTIVFVANQLAKFLRERNANVDIRTNNVLAYLHHWLTANVPCSLFPLSYPREPYGASYGIIEELPEKDPDYPPDPIDSDAKLVIEKLANSEGALKSESPVLLLGAISGLQLGSDHKIVADKDRGGRTLTSALENKVKKCFGPHVGSYHNKLFKRYMYYTGLPVMLFITEEKIDMEIIVGRCHFVLDQESDSIDGLTWDSFYQNHPVAFCVGCSGDTMDAKAQCFIDLGFEVIKGPQFEVSAFIARNNAFIEKIEEIMKK
ncbi:MAG: DUF4062 domain-containing protein [Thermodesulfobacteriota bacterium]|nr:DUF4062 domain-containing protein [Thermodesulfobacteriota bacterium]